MLVVFPPKLHESKTIAISLSDEFRPTMKCVATVEHLSSHNRTTADLAMKWMKFLAKEDNVHESSMVGDPAQEYATHVSRLTPLPKLHRILG